MTTSTNHTYHPSYWLSALGAGGLSVSFFMYLMWMLPYPDTAIPTWDSLVLLWRGDLNLSVGIQSLGMFATLAIIVLAVMHFVLLFWNVHQLRAPVNQAHLKALENSSAGVQLMTVPLTLAMTINVGFILGALFVPGLWSIVEYLFPAALLAFIWVGWTALRRYGRYLTQLLIKGGLRLEEHNHLSGLLAVFAFAMISVGLAAPAAMSNVAATSAIASTLSIFFFVIALIVMAIVLVVSIPAMLTHGLASKASPSIWMLVPILTLLGIEWLRLQHGLSTHFASIRDAGTMFYTLTIIFMVQIGLMAFGFHVMRMNGYLREHFTGTTRDPVSARSPLLCAA